MTELAPTPNRIPMPLPTPSRRRHILLATALAVVAVTLTGGAHAADSVNGSGSTFVHPIMLKWAASYHAKTQVQVNYQAIGSGGGIRQIKAAAVTFGASDKPLPPDELQASGLAQFPVVIGGVVPVVNLDGIKPGQLNFTGEVLADIYLGKITTWSDPAIVALNPDAKLPASKINVAYRSDGSGTTFNWVNYLSKVSPEWKNNVGDGTTVKWPVGTGGNGNEGVSRLVGFVKGSIGYVELAFAVQHKMTHAKVRNKAGAFVAPSPDSFQAAASNASWKAPDFYEVLTDAEGKDSWPITATTFVLMPRRAPDSAKSGAALQFFRWALEQGQTDARRLDYVPLPDSLVKMVESYWAENIR